MAKRFEADGITELYTEQVSLNRELESVQLQSSLRNGNYGWRKEETLLSRE